jgi:hypothetical protein
MSNQMSILHYPASWRRDRGSAVPFIAEVGAELPSEAVVVCCGCVIRPNA